MPLSSKLPSSQPITTAERSKDKNSFLSAVLTDNESMTAASIWTAALSIGALLTGTILWEVADRAACARGIALGKRPYLALVVAAALGTAVSPSDAVAAVACAAICVGAICDLRSGYIFDPVVGGGLGAVGAVAAWSGNAGAAAAGAAAVAGTLFGLWLLSGRRGLGMGDVKFGALIGAGMGPLYGLVALGAAFVLGAGASVGLLALGRARLDSAVRFGPYLAAGTLVVLAYHRLNTGVVP